MLIGIIGRFCKGEVLFRAEHGFCSFFLDECRNNGIVLREVRIFSDSVEARADAADYVKTEKAALRTGMEIKVLRRSGLPFIAAENKDRIGIPIGIILSVWLLFYFSSFIWEVTVEGNERIPSWVLTEELRQNGVYVGGALSKVDSEQIRFAIEKKHPDIARCSLNVTGCKAKLEVRETIRNEDDDLGFDFCNIVAAKDGEIIKADIFRGREKILPGTPVLKGDLLVAGILELPSGYLRYIKADAEITARTKNRVTIPLDDLHTGPNVKKCKAIRLLNIFGLTVPLTGYVKADDFTKEGSYLSTVRTVFPFGLERRTLFVLKDTADEADYISALMTAQTDLAEKVCSEFCGKTVERFSVGYDFGDTTSLFCETVCIEDIAENKPFSVEKSGNF